MIATYEMFLLGDKCFTKLKACRATPVAC